MEQADKVYTVVYEVTGEDGQKKQVREVKTLAEIVALVKQLETGQNIMFETETTDEAANLRDLVRRSLNQK